MRKLCLMLAVLMTFGAVAGCDAAPGTPDTDSTPADTTPAETDPLETDPPETEPPEPLTRPEKYTLRTVRPTAVTPTLDGKVTAEEWGDTPDFRLDAAVTGKQRTYCLDQYIGAGKLIPDMDFFWRYDDKYVYVAMRVKEPEPYPNPTGITMTGATRSVSVMMGNTYLHAGFADGALTDAAGNMLAFYTEENGVRSFEFAAPRASVMDGKDGFIGHVSYEVVIQYFRHNGSSGSVANLFTRSTPMYEDESYTDDVFVLEEGTPAPAPDLVIGGERSYSIADVDLGGGYVLQFSDPFVLARGDLGDQIWGHYQFPELRRFSDGTIQAAWSYHRDSIYELGGDKSPRPTYALTRDNGKTWELGGKITGFRDDHLMPNGKYFMGFAGGAAYETDYLNKYEPGLTWGDYKMYFAEDIVEKKDTVVYANEYDPVTKQTTRFEIRINWPYMPLTLYPGNYVYPVAQAFGLSYRAMKTVDGVLYLPLYCFGFDSFAPLREDAVKPYCGKFSVFFFKSEDCGRTWDLVSQIMMDGKIETAGDGVCEPEMTVLPDGSFVMLMRTGPANPSYVARSTDKGKTWSTLEKFDSLGVMPQLLTLDCGVTLASYGRPTMRFAATADADGASWTKFDMPMSGGAGTSCYYTDLVATGENTALYIYTDFLYPNEEGVPVKTVLVRTVTAIKK